MKKFYKQNRSLSYISFIALIVIIAYYLSYDLKEIYPGINKLFELGVTISVGIITNLIFFIFQVYRPQIQKENKYFLLLSDEVYNLLDLLWETFQIGEMCFDCNELDNYNVIVKKEELYYIKLETRNKISGLARKINIRLDYKSMLEKCENGIRKIGDSAELQECNSELIEIFKNLEHCNYLRAFLLAYNSGLDEKRSFGGLRSRVKYFELLKELSELVCPSKLFLISELGKEYRGMIDNKLGIISKKYDRIYTYITGNENMKFEID